MSCYSQCTASCIAGHQYISLCLTASVCLILSGWRALTLPCPAHSNPLNSRPVHLIRYSMCHLECRMNISNQMCPKLSFSLPPAPALLFPLAFRSQDTATVSSQMLRVKTSLPSLTPFISSCMQLVVIFCPIYLQYTPNPPLLITSTITMVWPATTVSHLDYCSIPSLVS